MANDPNRTVKVQRTTRDGRVLTTEIHVAKWEAGRQRGNKRGNSWERFGWQKVADKPAPAPKEAKKVEPPKQEIKQ